MLKAALAILLVATVIGVGWIVLYEDEDFTVSMRVQRADLSEPDEIPLDVDMRFESRKDIDTRVDRISLEIYNVRGGSCILVKEDGDFIIPADGETVRSYSVVLRNIDSVDDTIWVVLDIRLDGGETRHIEQEVRMGDYVPF